MLPVCQVAVRAVSDHGRAGVVARVVARSLCGWCPIREFVAYFSGDVFPAISTGRLLVLKMLTVMSGARVRAITRPVRGSTSFGEGEMPCAVRLVLQLPPPRVGFATQTHHGGSWHPSREVR